MGHMAGPTKTERNAFAVHLRTTFTHFCCEPSLVCNRTSVLFFVFPTHALGQCQATTFGRCDRNDIRGNSRAPCFVEIDVGWSNLKLSRLDSSMGTFRLEGGAP
jgi:hypothetical protein